MELKFDIEMFELHGKWIARCVVPYKVVEDKRLDRALDKLAAECVSVIDSAFLCSESAYEHGFLYNKSVAPEHILLCGSMISNMTIKVRDGLPRKWKDY